MANAQRVTIRLAREPAMDIDWWEKDRGKFVAEAVRSELDRSRHAELQRSLENPHPESANLIDEALREWADGYRSRTWRHSWTWALVSRFVGFPARAGPRDGE